MWLVKELRLPARTFTGKKELKKIDFQLPLLRWGFFLSLFVTQFSFRFVFFYGEGGGGGGGGGG